MYIEHNVNPSSKRVGDGFLETMTEEQLKAFAGSVMRKMN